MTIEEGKAYRIHLAELGRTVKAHVMYTLGGYYKGDVRVVFRYYSRYQYWRMKMVKIEDFNGCIERAKKIK